MHAAWALAVLGLAGCTVLEPGDVVRPGDAAAPIADAHVPMDARAAMDADPPMDGGARVDAPDVDRDGGLVDAPDTPPDAGSDAGSDGGSDAGPDGGPPRVLRVTAGGRHTCAIIDDDRELVCWGARDYGQLGSSAPPGRAPFRTGIRRVFDVCTGDDFTCVARPTPGDDAGVMLTVECSGIDDRGQLGGGARDAGVPAGSNEVGRWASPIDLVCGANHACVLDSAGVLTCWGDNTERQVDFVTSSVMPPTILDFGRATPTAPSLGNGHSCAVLVSTTSAAWCWGRRSATGQPDFEGHSIMSGARLVAAGSSFTCALAADSSSLLCVGDDTTAGESALIALVRAESVAFAVFDAGEEFACGATPTRLICWGRADEGQIGAIHASPSFEDLALPLGRRIRDLSTGAAHACIVMDDGSVRCWGRNGDGQATGSATPTAAGPAAVDLSGI